MSSISFDNIYLLIIAAPLVVFFTAAFLLSVKKGNRNLHNVASYVIHIVIACIVAFAAAQPTITVSKNGTEVLVLADVSDSVGDRSQDIDSYIRGLQLPEGSKLGLVCFAKEAQLVSAFSDPKRVASVSKADVDGSETNIISALEYAEGLFSPNAIKRIVVITDGADSDSRDPDALRLAVNRLNAQNIRVDAIYLDSNLPADVKEVQASGAEYAHSVYANRQESVSVSIEASYNARAIVTLKKDGEQYRQTALVLSVGRNNINFDLDTSAAGEHSYEVEVNAEEDASPLNNSYAFKQYVTDVKSVLVLTGSWNEAMAMIKKYDGARLTIYENDGSVLAAIKNRQLAPYAEREGLTVHVNDINVPYGIEGLCEFDEIVIDNIDICDVYNYTEFIKNVDVAVSLYGKSLVTVGNLHAQNRDEAELTALENMLPVSFGNREDDPKIYTLVIDASRSMEMLSHLIVAKQVATRLVELLNERDEVLIITFFGDVYVLQTPTPLNDRDAIIERINSIDATQGTVIGRSLRTAHEYLRGLPYSDKQVMLITDGLSYTDEEDRPADVAAEMYDDGIVTSVFDVGRQGDDKNGNNANSVAADAKRTLQNVATNGGGNYYYSNNEETLDEVTFGKVSDVATDTVIERQTAVNIERPLDSVLEGIEALPDVGGYVYANSKASATTVLTVEHMRSSGSAKKPLYAYWKYGNGRVSSYLSAYSGEWVSGWGEELIDTLMDNVLKVNIPEQRVDVPYELQVERAGKYTRIRITPETIHFDAKATLTVTYPDGTNSTQDMQFDALSYYFDILTDDLGNYGIEIYYAYGGYEFVKHEEVYITSKAEYDAFTAYDASTLHRAVDGVGDVSVESGFRLSENYRLGDRYMLRLAIPLLIAAIVLFGVDVIVRKLKWEDIKSFFKPRSKKNRGEHGSEGGDVQ